MHANPADDELRRILTTATTIAIVGASTNPERPSHGIMKQLLAAGYRVVPVNPGETSILGQTAYPSLAAIPHKVDIVDVFRRAEETPQIAADAIAIGAKVLWLQLGVSNENAADRARAAGLEVVMDACIGATHRRLEIPGRAG